MASCTQVNSLFQAYIDGELEGAEKAILEQHLRDCGACCHELSEQRACSARLFESLHDQRLMWGLRSRVLAHLPEMDAALQHRSHPTDPKYAMKKQRPHFPWLFSAAAAVFLIFAAAFIYSGASVGGDPAATVGMIAYSHGNGVLRKPAATEEYERAELKSLVSEGEQYETLSDGRLAIALIGDSIVKANYNSLLTVADNRRVSVTSGQTFFDIGRDRRHFYVDTPMGEILVFGTAFLVEVDGNQTTLTVTEGDVLVKNDVGKMAVSYGNQLVFTRNEPLGMPYPVDISEWIGWADEIVPDADAMALFRQTLEYNRATSTFIPAEPVHVAPDLRGRAVESIILEWVPDGQSDGHCNYILHVTDSTGKLLLLDSFSSAHFNNPSLSRIEVSPPNGPIENVDTLYVRLKPDYTAGSNEVEFSVSVGVVGL